MIPDWVENWEAPETPNDWAWKERHNLYRFAIALLSYGPVVTGKQSVSPQRIMLNTALRVKPRAFAKALKLMQENPAPVKPPKEKRAASKVGPLFSPPPVYDPAKMPAIQQWANLAFQCFPEEPEAIRLKRLALEIETKALLGKEPKAPWSSYWVCSRALVPLAYVERDGYVVPLDVLKVLMEGRTIWHLLLDLRALGFPTHGPEDAGADGGTAPDQDLSPDGGEGDDDWPGAGSLAVPGDDGGLDEGLEVFD